MIAPWVVETVVHPAGCPIHVTGAESARPGGGRGADDRLELRLLESLLSATGHDAADRESMTRPGRLAVTHDRMGRPALLVDGRAGPAVSFTRSGGLLRAALAHVHGLGIDLADDAEFAGDYPRHRAFGPAELALALAGVGGGMAAALLWAVKESVVKALGSGFHGVEPRAVAVGSIAPRHDGLVCGVRVDGRAGPIVAWARREPSGWFALTALDEVS
ncbi:MAG: 4'-phosphopantetheinyl transferase superfamily protein [Candidatus Riflebacteria bacterium]|nr:4'-phosphopantetheinyl transferase superfamily protein [Candidatus Riflebacteria bacterium]